MAKSKAKRAAPAKKDAAAPAKKQTGKKAAKKKATKKTKAAAPAKQEAPVRAAAPVKPSKKAAKKTAKASSSKKASKRAAAKIEVSMPAVAAVVQKAVKKVKKAVKKVKTELAPVTAPIKKAVKKIESELAPVAAPIKKAVKKAAAKTDIAPPPPPAVPIKKATKKAAKTDVAPPAAAPTTPAPARAAPKKRAAKKAAAKPESTDDDGGHAPAAAQTGGAGASAFRGFGEGLFEFLTELALHNDRDWFEANKRRYESEVREPALAFIRAIGSRLSELSEHFVASDQKVGGSLMRIHRDTRFSPDKTPYKTNLGVQFRHAAGKDVHAPGLYFHVDSDGVFLASGTWHPDTEPLAAIRNAIVERPDAWKRVRDDKGFRKHWALEGESLSRPPRGFDKDHVHIDDLRRKDHIAVCRLSADDITRADMVDRITERYLASAPYLRFLCEAIGVAF